MQIVTEYWRKPIPTNRFDWSAWYDGQEESGPIGHGSTEQKAINELKELTDE